jgi:hypothetical protein
MHILFIYKYIYIYIYITIGNSKILKPGSILKFPLTSKKTADKVYGKIVCYAVDRLDKEEQFFYGAGKIVYIRMPVEVCICIYIYVYICMYRYVYDICMYRYVYIDIYTYEHL